MHTPLDSAAFVRFRTGYLRADGLKVIPSADHDGALAWHVTIATDGHEAEVLAVFPVGDDTQDDLVRIHTHFPPAAWARPWLVPWVTEAPPPGTALILPRLPAADVKAGHRVAVVAEMWLYGHRAASVTRWWPIADQGTATPGEE